MSLKPVYKQLVTLSSTPSNNDKIGLLQEYLKDPLFQKVSIYALDSRRTYKVKKFPPFIARQAPAINEEVFEHLDFLNDSAGATAVYKKQLFELASTDEETYEVVRRICNGDLQCGCGVKTFNKALIDAIFYIPYCRCSSDTKIDRIIYPAIIQEKEDGMFVNMIMSVKGKVKFLTREGNKIKQLKKLKKHIERTMPTEGWGRVYTGELLIKYKDGTLMDRQESNGIFNSCKHGSADQIIADYAAIHVWDSIPIDAFWEGIYKVPYVDRWKFVCTMVDAVSSPLFSKVLSQVVDSLEEAHAFYAEMRALKREGSVLKNLLMIWKDHTSTNAVKMKNVMDVELNFVGWYYGEENTKYEKCLGGMMFESRCGMLKVKVGGGFSDRQRGYVPVHVTESDAILATQALPVYISDAIRIAVLNDLDDTVGEVAQIECERLSTSKSKDTYSLYAPRFLHFRRDKLADTLESLLTR